MEDRKWEECKREEKRKWVELQQETKRQKESIECYEDDCNDSKYNEGFDMQTLLFDQMRKATLEAKERPHEREELVVCPPKEIEHKKWWRESLHKSELPIEREQPASQQWDGDLVRARERDAERLRAKECGRQQRELYVKTETSHDVVTVCTEPTDSGPSNDKAVAGVDKSQRNDYAVEADLGTSSFTYGNESSKPPTLSTSMINLEQRAANVTKKGRFEVKDVASVHDKSEKAVSPKNRRLAPRTSRRNAARCSLT